MRVRPQRSRPELKLHYDAAAGQCMIRCKRALSLSAGPWKHIASNDGIIHPPDPEGAVTLQLRTAAADPSVSSAGCCGPSV